MQLPWFTKPQTIPDRPMDDGDGVIRTLPEVFVHISESYECANRDMLACSLQHTLFQVASNAFGEQLEIYSIFCRLEDAARQLGFEVVGSHKYFMIETALKEWLLIDVITIIVVGRAVTLV